MFKTCFLAKRKCFYVILYDVLRIVYCDISKNYKFYS